MKIKNNETGYLVNYNSNEIPKGTINVINNREKFKEIASKWRNDMIGIK